MSHATSPIAVDFAEAVKNLVTEDDEPVDNLFSAKQQRLLVSALYGGYTPPENLPEDLADSELPASRKFLTDANVGIFTSPYLPPLVPDAFLSLDVEPHPDWHMQEHRAYFIWEFEKPPDVVVEIVSNRIGHELDEKRRRYAKMGVTYYVVFDPWRHLSDEVLRVYERGFGNRYRQRPDFVLPAAGLQVTLWQGVFEDWEDTWLRWCDRDGKLIATPEERAISAEERAISAEERAVSAEERAVSAEEHAARLAAQLRALGVEPDKL